MAIKYVYPVVSLLFLSLSINAQTTFNVLDYGAKGDGKTLNTESIQKAIDQCYRGGGGTVVIPSGTFMSGTLVLKSNITLHLDPAAVLLGAPEVDQYEPHLALIYATNQENISISGTGKIDGNGINGHFFEGNRHKGAFDKRPSTIRFGNCRFVNLKNFTLTNGAGWGTFLSECINVSVHDINVISNVIADGIGLWRPEVNPIYRKINKDPRIGVTIAGMPGFQVENVSLSNIYLQFTGGGTLDDANRILEDNPHPYPEYNKFGITPAYGFNCRYVKNIVFDNIMLDWIDHDVRPAMFFERSKEISIANLKSKVSSEAKSFIRLKDVGVVWVYGCKTDAVQIPFLSLEGQIHDVSLVGNDLHKLEKAYVAEPSVDISEYYEK